MDVKVSDLESFKLEIIIITFKIQFAFFDPFFNKRITKTKKRFIPQSKLFQTTYLPQKWKKRKKIRSTLWMVSFYYSASKDCVRMEVIF